MKKTLLVLCALAFGLNILANDIIVLRNGDFINGKVIEVASNQIKYKKATNPDGPLYTLEKNEVLSIKYENGDVDKFELSNSDIKLEESQNTRIIAAPKRNCTLSTPLRFAFSLASRMASGTISMPTTSLACRASISDMVPAPQYTSATSSLPVNAANSSAVP